MTQTTDTSIAGYSTPADTIKKTAFITSYEAGK
jgi:hypothetical protein